MRDPLDSLSRLQPGGAMDPLPAAEVRRRGDARRRRRTATIAAGAMLAVAAVVIPVALLATDRGTPLEPATSPEQAESTSVEAGAPTDIPADFPLADGLPTGAEIQLDGPAPRGDTEIGLSSWEPCQVPIWPSGGLDTLDVVASGPELLESRELATYADADEAVAVLERAREALDGCDSHPGGDAQTLVTLDGGTGYDDVTFAIYDASGAPWGTVVQMMRVGSAVVLSASAGEYTADSVAAGAEDLTVRSSELAQSMCLFTVDGCTEPSPSPTAPATEQPSADPGEGSTIPGDFPLDRYLPTGSDYQRLDPNEGDDGIDPCGQPIWPAGHHEAYGVMAVGPEHVEIRWLATFGDADRAVAVLEQARTVLAGCQTSGADGSIAVLELPGDTGYDTVTFATVQASGQPGGEVYQLMRVGSAVLVSTSGGELTADSAQAVADELTAQSRDLAAEMCVFTAAGC